LDDGRLTDGQGHTVDFSNTLIILTSNVGSGLLAAQSGEEDVDIVRNSVMEELRSSFRPEFLNRLDEIILFQRLTRDQMGAIVDIQVMRLGRLLDDRNITLQLDTPARVWLADAGYDPVYGARPLKRVIQRQLQDRLAKLILEGKLGEGETVGISANDTGLSINGRAVETAA
jgi:ATP-dependent Clp protease ATP-binding subunit ClpB